MCDKFDASASAAGYFYQARYALLQLLRSGPGSQISIETLDDIHVQSQNQDTLLQLKHSTLGKSNISDASPNIWKTLYIWINRMEEGKIDPKRDHLQFVTTTKLPKSSVLSKLRPSRTKEELSEALKTLSKVATNSTHAKLKHIFLKYSSMQSSNREDLLGMIEVLDGKPDVVNLEEQIRQQLAIACRPQFLDQVLRRLEGWWTSVVVKHLLKKKHFISFSELQLTINDIQEEYQQDNLPIEFLKLKPPEEEDIEQKDQVFIKQLRVIAVGNPRIKKAIADYFRAFNQRTRWVEDGNLDPDSLDRYDDLLKDEWERAFHEMSENLRSSNSSCKKQQAGRDLYNELQRRSDLDIRERCTKAFVMRGSFHLLANQLEIGWHPDFNNLLKASFDQALEVVSEELE